MKEVYIVSVSRTPVGSFNGALASYTATQLGAHAVKSALAKIDLKGNLIDEIFVGHVLSANAGQAPATQVAIYAGLGDKIPATSVNKVCASGMKAVMLAAQSIMIGDNTICVAGGMESMSNAPYYLDKARTGYKYGHQQVLDSIVKDGLWDVYNNYPMGNAGELCAKTYNISREAQDAYAVESYRRAQEATKNGSFKDEITPIEVQKGKETVLMTEDEDVSKVIFDKVPFLKPVFDKSGTITAANASNINDGAAALVLMSKEKCEELGFTPLAKIVAFADAAQAPEWFTTAPALAIPKALDKAGILPEEVDYYEINEAFSVVCIANNQLLGLDAERVNVFGGAVSMGHPIGCSGARIVATLVSVLIAKGGKVGVASVCNGGGGASAMVLQRV